MTTVFDGELDATDVFVSLISQKYGKTNAKEYLAKKKDIGYNEDEVHDVYRALDVLGTECALIQAEVYKNSHFLGQRNDKILYYDCSNYYFEIEQEDGSKKYGKINNADWNGRRARESGCGMDCTAYSFMLC